MRERFERSFDTVIAGMGPVKSVPGNAGILQLPGSQVQNHVEGRGTCDWESDSIRLWVTFGFFAQVQFGGHPGLTRGADGFVKEKNRSLETAVNELVILGPFRSHPVPGFLAFTSCGQPAGVGLAFLPMSALENM